MKYLIDECMGLKKQLIKNKDILLSRDVLGEGTPDSEILDYAVKKNLILVTNDMKFALRTAMKHHPVLYTGFQGGFKISAERTDDAVRFCGSKTFYLLENDKVVIP